MTKEQLTNRILSAEAGIDSQAFRTGALTASDWEYLALATEKLHDAPIYMDDTSSITITEMKAKIAPDQPGPQPAQHRPDCHRLSPADDLRPADREPGPGDQLHHPKPQDHGQGDECPHHCPEPAVPCVEKQGNNSSHRPQLSDLRDSGSIEQDADCVLFLYRDSYYASQQPDGAEVDADTAECIVAKNRHGETSTVPLGWDGAHTRFMDVDFQH